MGKSMLKISGLDELQKDLKKMQKKLKKYEGECHVTLPYSQKQWDNMTEIEKKEAMEEAQKEYIEKIKKDVFN